MAATQYRGSRTHRFLVYHLPALAFAMAILIVSSIPNLAGPGSSVFGFDKLAHFGEYALLNWLVLRSFSRLSGRGSATGMLLIATVTVMVFAACDEYLQSFVPGRDSTIADFAADSLGAIGAALWWRAKMYRN